MMKRTNAIKEPAAIPNPSATMFLIILKAATPMNMVGEPACMMSRKSGSEANNTGNQYQISSIFFPVRYRIAQVFSM